MAKAKIKPIGDRVLVKHLDDSKEQVRGGIIIPDSAKEKPQEAEVIAVGNKKDENGKAVEFEVKIGDKVLISKYGGTEVKIDDEKYTIVREDDILGVIA